MLTKMVQEAIQAVAIEKDLFKMLEIVGSWLANDKLAGLTRRKLKDLAIQQGTTSQHYLAQDSPTFSGAKTQGGKGLWFLAVDASGSKEPECAPQTLIAWGINANDKWILVTIQCKPYKKKQTGKWWCFEATNVELAISSPKEIASTANISASDMFWEIRYALIKQKERLEIALQVASERCEELNAIRHCVEALLPESNEQ